MSFFLSTLTATGLQTTYSTTIMQHPHDINLGYQAKLLMKGPSENCTTKPPLFVPPHPLEDNLFLFPALSVSYP